MTLPLAIVIMFFVAFFAQDIRSFANRQFVRLVGRPTAQALSPHVRSDKDREHLLGWLAVFRETVIAAEGTLTEDLAARIQDETPSEKLLDDARRMAASIIATANDELAEVRNQFLVSDESFARDLVNEVNVALYRKRGKGKVIDWDNLSDFHKEGWIVIAKTVREKFMKIAR